MTYYKKIEFNLLGYRKSKRKNTKYDAILENKKTKKINYVPFGSTLYQNYADKTGLNLYPKLLHGDRTRKIAYRRRHFKDLKDGYYSPGWFSYFILW